MKASTDVKGLVANIQDYAVHDGYGLRSIVFLKGCALRCNWCQNPECVEPKVEVIFRQNSCMHCKRCFDVCPRSAIKETLDGRIDRTLCDGCMLCVDICPSRALSRVGFWFSPDQVLTTLLQYKPFYDTSDRGGVTLSGGEPLFQPDFTLAVLKLAKEQGIHTAVETCGYSSYDILYKVSEYLDLVLYDIKHMDPVQHKIGTGVENDRILSNLNNLRRDRESLECVVRIPLIPGFNDGMEDIRRTAEFVAGLGIKQVDLLPFNELASAKYKEMGKKWAYEKVRRQENQALSQMAEAVESYGLRVTVGGLW